MEILIEDWYFIKNNEGYLFLGGRVMNDPRFKPGFAIITSEVQNIDQISEIVETKNSAYKLGKVNPAYKCFHAPKFELAPSPILIGKCN